MDEVIKKRTIKVEGMTCEGCEKRINDALSKLQGVIEAKADKSGKVYVTYDLMKIKLINIEGEITKLGYSFPDKLLPKMKHSYIHDSEATEFENMNLPDAPCCSNPDALSKK